MRDILKHEVTQKGGKIGITREALGLEDGFALGGEDESAVVYSIIEWFLS